MSLPLRFSADLDRDCVRKGGALEAVAADLITISAACVPSEECR